MTWAERVQICIETGHVWVYQPYTIWHVCSRCGCQTTGSLDT